jgi:hypothetical protein
MTRYQKFLCWMWGFAGFYTLGIVLNVVAFRLDLARGNPVAVGFDAFNVLGMVGLLIHLIFFVWRSP